MQGSRTGKGIQEQNYRDQIRQALRILHPFAEITDPFELFPDSVDYDDNKAKDVLFSMATKAAEADLVIAYLPNASMGSALEMIRGYDAGKPIFTISPMATNWFIIAVSTRIFPTLEEFCHWVSENKITIN
jgi:hypothetical protein